MRRTFVLLHRWFGLFTACFLLIAGLTGSLIAWDHELDAWLNPELTHAPHRAPLIPSTELARRLEAADPRVRVGYVPLSVERDHSLSLFVQPRNDPSSGKPYELGFNEVFVDPSDGRVLGKRESGAFSLARENLMPFLYRLHYSLHVPAAGEIEPGMWWMGLVAIVWTLDALIALYISFPSRKVWRKSFAFRFGQGPHKLTFDLHRSSGVWLWPVLFVFGFTAVSMNLEDELVRPMVGVFSPVASSPYDSEQHPEWVEHTPTIGRDEAVAIASREATARGIQAPAGAVYYAAMQGFYSVGFFAPGNGHGDGGLGNPWLFVDAQTGRMKAAEIPGEGSAGDLFMQVQFPLHSGRILGIGGRIAVTVLGLVVAMLSFTGVWLWAKKRIARARASSGVRSGSQS